jgi:hypothetical protein
MLSGNTILALLPAIWHFQGARLKTQFGRFFGSYKFQGKLKSSCGGLFTVYFL